MRPLLLGLAALALLGGCRNQGEEGNAAAGAGAGTAQPHKIDRSHAGQPAPSTPFTGPGGAKVTLASFRGKPVLLNLWATWCAPCVKEMPALDRLAAAHAGEVQVIALSQDEKGKATVEAFLKKAKIDALAPYLDPDNAIMPALKVEMLPTTILFDANGREVWRVAADRDWDNAETAALLAEARRGRG